VPYPETREYVVRDYEEPSQSRKELVPREDLTLEQQENVLEQLNGLVITDVEEGLLSPPPPPVYGYREIMPTKTQHLPLKMTGGFTSNNHPFPPP
jgi:hypothetical protein